LRQNDGNGKKYEDKYILLMASWQKVNDVKKWIELMNSGDRRTTTVEQPEKAVNEIEESEDDERWFEIDDWMENTDDGDFPLS